MWCSQGQSRKEGKVGKPEIFPGSPVPGEEVQGVLENSYAACSVGLSTRPTVVFAAQFVVIPSCRTLPINPHQLVVMRPMVRYVTVEGFLDRTAEALRQFLVRC